jgi:hypothetical protein
MSNGVLRASAQALALAASLGLAMPTGAVALPALSPMTVAATASANNLVAPAAWRRIWRHRRYGWGPGAAFAAAAFGIIGLGIANSYQDPYACDPYDPYDYPGWCGPSYGYAYGYPYGYGYGRDFRGYRRFGGARYGGFGHSFAHSGFGGRFAHGGVPWIQGHHR